MPHNEVEIYDLFAQDLASGVDIVDRKSYNIIVDSRRKDLLKRWLSQRRGIFLDYGCGNGSFSRFVAEDLGTNVVGVDLSKGMIRLSSYKSKGASKAMFLVADCHALPFRDKSFDAILGMGIFHHLRWRRAIFECHRLLKEGGVLVAFEPNSFGLLALLGRKLFKTKIHTSDERPINPWSFIKEMERKGFRVINLSFFSFLGFAFPFILASNPGHLIKILRRRAIYLKTIDRLFEKIPVVKFLCWLFGIVGIKKNE